jgi:EAL domain-containing protein (putative c-di-GMP-specific phosphodiesterase class I)
LFQPIISVGDGSIKGLELLGRGSHPDLSELPVPLFSLAESLGRSVELSEMIRGVGVRAWATSDLGHVPLFVNTDPRELRDCQRLFCSLRDLHNEFPEHSLVLEIHEHSVTDQQSLSTLHQALLDLNIQLAYDDFGAGQARLLELLDTPPYAVKFDISMIQDLHTVSTERREMIGLLVRMVKKGRALALAEGVSRPEELVVCRQLAFDLVQGYLYGQPALITQLEA